MVGLTDHVRAVTALAEIGSGALSVKLLGVSPTCADLGKEDQQRVISRV